MKRLVCAVGLLLGTAGAPVAETIRVASFNAELQRDGPGLLLRDIGKGDDPQITAVAEVLARVRPDVLALQGVDWDAGGRALSALVVRLSDGGLTYPYRFSARPNAGVQSGLDLDGDERLGEPEDSLGFGDFTGQGGLAVLSRFPIDEPRVRDFTALPWSALPDALLPHWPDGGLFPDPQVAMTRPLSSSAHWVVPIQHPDIGKITVLTYRAGPPVFDGPEDANGRRNHDETRLWTLFLDGQFGPAPTARFVLAGSATMDPFDSDGRPGALRALLADPRLQDPHPTSPGAAAAPDQGHQGANALDTVDWPPPGPGRLRVDYVLPSADWEVAGTGVFWPAPGADGHDAALAASRHRLVWVDLIATPAP